jgi:DNA-binding MarR family transcriptional regulator
MQQSYSRRAMDLDLRPDSPIDQFPGYLIRRLSQILLARFAVATEAYNVTPLQWAAMRAAQARPGMDQTTLAREIALDTSTLAGVVDRLEARGLLARRPSAQDRRLRTVFITDEGAALLALVSPVIVDVQRWLMDPLSAEEGEQFFNALRKLVDRPAAGDPATPGD